MSELNKWEIWLARVPYEDEPNEKVRPVLVLEDQQIYVLAYKMTKHEPRKGFPGEYAVSAWKKAGLKVPTTIRAGKKLRLERTRMLQKIGFLQTTDIVGLTLFLKENK